MTKTSIFTTIAVATSLAVSATVASAQALYYTAGHGDFGVSYTPGDTTFGLHWGLDAGATVDGETLTIHTEYAPDELIAWTTATNTTPSNSASWLGVTGGSTVYRLGTDSYPPNLGFNSSGAGSDEQWFDSTLNITLVGWTTPEGGEVAFLSGSTPSASTLFSTYDPGSTINDNTWEFDMGVGHAHLVGYFSVAGTYELTFNWSGTYIGDGTIEPVEVSGTGTFVIQVGEIAVPEPATYAAIFGVATLALAMWRHHRI